MSSASLTPREASFADFPPVQEGRAGFWFVGLAAAAVEDREPVVRLKPQNVAGVMRLRAA